jgi:dTDP-4-dehydrorhamnose 3,5-epimerase
MLLDERGYFCKILDTRMIHGLPKFEIRDYFLTNSGPNVIRGMHLMNGEFANNRIIHVSKGEILDVLIDLRVVNTFQLKKSFNNLGPHCEFDTVFVPKGIAHGFSTKSEAEVIYLSDREHNKDSDIGFNPLSFGQNWEVDDPTISERDLQLPTFDKFNR